MDDWNLPRTGACRCGRVGLRIDAAPLLTTACHCTGCRRMSSSACSLSVAVPADGFSERLPWASTPATHGFETFPPLEDCLPLTEAFAAR